MQTTTFMLSSLPVSRLTSCTLAGYFAWSSPSAEALATFLAVATTLLSVVSRMPLTRLNPSPRLLPVITTTVFASKATLGLLVAAMSNSVCVNSAMVIGFACFHHSKLLAGSNMKDQAKPISSSIGKSINAIYRPVPRTSDSGLGSQM